MEKNPEKHAAQRAALEAARKGVTAITDGGGVSYGAVRLAAA